MPTVSESIHNAIEDRLAKSVTELDEFVDRIFKSVILDMIGIENNRGHYRVKSYHSGDYDSILSTLIDNTVTTVVEEKLSVTIKNKIDKILDYKSLQKSFHEVLEATIKDNIADSIQRITYNVIEREANKFVTVLNDKFKEDIEAALHDHVKKLHFDATDPESCDSELAEVITKYFAKVALTGYNADGY
jgi:hypothetical protein